MKALLQRVTEASVAVDGATVAKIGSGLLVFVCAEQTDGPEQAAFIARKVANLRIFPDTVGKMNRSLLNTGGEVLVVSQFTLCADLGRGNRPSFAAAADPDTGRVLCEQVSLLLSEHGVKVKSGRFASHMAVRLVNDGPVTIWLETR